MRIAARTLGYFLFLLIAAPPSVFGQTVVPIAYPGAKGFGSLATGGRGGDVYIVTNLNDDGAGSLRFGLENSPSRRTVVFEVAGTIELADRLRIRDKQNITIAGQTAPGEGILLRGGPFQIDNCSNIIVRHLRVRYGWDVENEADAFSVSNTRNAIFDHISASWGMDETFSLTGDTSHVTIQDSIIAEGVKHRHQYGTLIDTRTTGGGRITLFRNLYINHLGRMPRASSGNNEAMLVNMVNNVVYNWGTEGDWGVQGTALNAETQSNWNFVRNYSIAGLATRTSSAARTILRGGTGVDTFYIEGNKCDFNRDGILDGVEAGWDFVGGTFRQRNTPFTIPGWARVTGVTTPDAALERIIEDAGARPWGRDAVDTRLISELVTWGTAGVISGPANRPEWPTLAESTGPVDTDRDGKPDFWEDWYGTSPTEPSHNLVGQDGYTALELYLQWLIDPESVFSLDEIVENGSFVLFR